MTAPHAFQTVDELKAYLEQEKLPCLLCGKAFNGLYTHINFCHDMTADDYRAMFGIPKHCGLSGTLLRDKQSKRLKTQRSAGQIPQSPPKAHLDRLHTMARGKKREVLPCHIDAIRRAKARPKPLVDSSVYHEFLRRIEKGRSIRDVAQDTDMPGMYSFQQFRRLHPDFDIKVNSALENLPFMVQIKERCVGTGLRLLILMLREWEGQAWSEVDETLLLPQGKARQIYHRMSKAGELTRYRELAAA